MRRLILVKHSLPRIEPDVPRREWRLSQDGLERCRLLAGHLARYGPALVVSSPEPKAYETALAVTAAVNAIDVRTIWDLRELDDGGAAFEGETAFRANVAAFFARPTEPVFGADTADGAHARFVTAIDASATGDVAHSIVAVTHGRVMSLFVARRTGLDPFALWLRLGLPSVIVLALPEYRLESVVEQV